MARNVLLMLSSNADPHPLQEVAWHEDHCREHDTTTIITTRVLTEMVPEQSVVAFYGDAGIENRYLGKGIFIGFIRIGTVEGQQLLRDHALYRNGNHPKEPGGFIKVRQFTRAQPGEGITSLQGIIDSTGISNGKELAIENFPQTAARLQIYYNQAAIVGGAQ
jgi:hypothetical protein